MARKFQPTSRIIQVSQCLQSKRPRVISWSKELGWKHEITANYSRHSNPSLGTLPFPGWKPIIGISIGWIAWSWNLLESEVFYPIRTIPLWLNWNNTFSQKDRQSAPSWIGQDARMSPTRSPGCPGILNTGSHRNSWMSPKATSYVEGICLQAIPKPHIQWVDRKWPIAGRFLFTKEGC